MGRLVVALLLCAGGQGLAEEYRLGTQDRLRIDVYEYPNLNGEYAIGGAGTVALPLLGEVEAAGITPRALAARINARLQALSESAAASSATVEVVGYRPFFILGDVQNPGPYAYQPGLRMVQALALAGGTYRLQDPGLVRLSRDAISAEGEIRMLRAREFDLLAERVRLEAELREDEELAFPEELPASAPDAATARAVMDRQLTLFAVRREAFLKQTGTLNRLVVSLKDEVAALDRQTALKGKQIDTVAQELGSTRILIGKGLAPQARGLELERLAADIEGDQQEVATQKLRAQQAIAETEQALLSLADDRQSQAAAALRDVDERLRETRAGIGTQASLLREAVMLAPEAVRYRMELASGPVGYAVARFSDDGSLSLAAAAGDPVAPGDVITVRFQTALEPGVVESAGN